MQQIAKNHMVQLDGLRFTAVTIVLFNHWVRYPQIELLSDTLAATSLHLFFVLSAFLITSILLNAKNAAGTTPHSFTLRQFYTRRFLRIFPLYYLVVILGYAINFPTARQNVVWYLTYTTNIARFFYGINCGYFSHLWSLAVEEQFYLLFPLLVLFIPNKYLVKTFVVIIGISILSKYVPYLVTANVDRADKIANGTLPGCFNCFALGALLAYYKVVDAAKLQSILKRKKFFLLCLVIYLPLSVIHFYNKGWLPVLLFWQFNSCVLCFWLVGTASLNQFTRGLKLYLEHGAVGYLSKISYGLYVYHYFIPGILFALGLKYYSFTGGLLVYALLYFLVTIVVSMISWHLYENPLNNLKRFIPYNR